MSAHQIPTPGSKILVSGVSGFVGIHCVESLLNAGFKVVGSVRSAEKGEYVKKTFAGKPFEYVIVENVGAPGAFDEAVKDVEGVLHTASPFHMQAKEPEELIRPAVDGTINIMKSVVAYGQNVKRVVVTSSVAAIMEPVEPPHTFTEADWNEFSPRECEEKGKDASPMHIYLASKALAEKAAWELADKSHFSFATILPSYVLGPILQDVKSPDSINTSVAIFYQLLKDGVKPEDLPGPIGSWVDVRDVADAHRLALTTPEAGGERFVISASPFYKQDLVEALERVDPSVNLTKGQRGAAQEADDPANAVIMSGEKAKRVLGLKYTSLEDSVAAMYKSIKNKGF